MYRLKSERFPEDSRPLKKVRRKTPEFYNLLNELQEISKTHNNEAILDNLVIRSTGSIVPLAESLIGFMLDTKPNGINIS